MPFEPITHIKLKSDGDPLSKGSIKVYTRLLNHLALEGYDTLHKLLTQPEEVLALIDEMVEGDTDGARTIKRQYLSAIFYALDTVPLEQKSQYYDYFQKVKQNYGKA